MTFGNRRLDKKSCGDIIVLKGNNDREQIRKMSDLDLPEVNMRRLIFHVDVNSAFLSWEASSRVSRDMDDLRLVPSAIGGEKDKRTGVILAKSIPAKKYGVTTGESVASALRKCPELLIVPPDFVLYQKCSRDFMEICRIYAPVVEKFSIDECFMDMSGTSRLYPDFLSVAFEVKDRIKRELGFTVNIGISDKRLLAKMASDFEKPDKVHTLFSDETEKKLWPLPVDSLFSVGKSTAEKLRRACIFTIGDIARTDTRLLQTIVGVKAGQQLHDFACGIDTSEVSGTRDEAKGYSVSTTLEKDVTEYREAYRVLLALTDSVASRMRADGMNAGCVSVTFRSGDFKDRSHQKRLYDATDITSEIYETVKQLFNELWDSGTPIRLLGVSLTNLSRNAGEQISFFHDEKRERAIKTDRAVDELRGRFGSDAIVRASFYQAPIHVGKKYKASLDEAVSSQHGSDDADSKAKGVQEITEGLPENGKKSIQL